MVVEANTRKNKNRLHYVKGQEKLSQSMVSFLVYDFVWGQLAISKDVLAGK